MNGDSALGGIFILVAIIFGILISTLLGIIGDRLAAAIRLLKDQLAAIRQIRDKHLTRIDDDAPYLGPSRQSGHQSR